MREDTHHDPQGFEDVEFTHGARTVLVQPGVHTHLVEDMPGTDTGRESEGVRGREREGEVTGRVTIFSNNDSNNEYIVQK